MAERESLQATPEPGTILVVEDDPETQSLLNDVLTTAGYAATVVGTGNAALERIETTPFDLMLLDVWLPDIDGHEVCRRVRDNHGVDVPIVMLTAATQSQSVVQGLLQADDYVSKPFVPQELVLRISRLLKRSRDRLALAEQNAGLQTMLKLVQRDLDSAHQATQTESLMRYELLHNVTTHLQSLTAIVEAELRKLPPSPERDAVQRIRGRVRAAALVYQVSAALQTEPVAIGEVIRMTASALKSIYRPWKRISVTVNGDAVFLPATQAAPVAMIVNELVTNCFKHAFPDNRFGAISISYTADERQFCLEVSDDGVGLPTESSSTGHGKQLVRQLVQSLDGAVTWRNVSSGTQVVVHVPRTTMPA